MSKASVTNFARISEEYRENQLRNIQFSCRQSSEYLKVSVFYFVEETKYKKYSIHSLAQTQDELDIVMELLEV